MNVINSLYQEMEQRGLDAMLIINRINVSYVSGYTGDEAYLLMSPRENFIITDPRYTEQCSIECPDYTIVDWRSVNNSLPVTVAQIAERLGFRTVGYETIRMNVQNYLRFQEVMKAEMIPADGIIEEYRAVKRPEEIACMRTACEISCRAFDRILKEIRVGVTEKELAARLSLFMVMEGSDTMPYGNILISGARTSLLHGIPSDKPVEKGDLVLMDYGCAYHGYLSDMTRTVVVGKASEKQREVYALEQKMCAAELSMLKEGANGYDIYKKGVEIIEGTEYFPYHYPNTGHGIGMFVHEVPFHGWKAKDVTLKAGNVMTVEPGIYIPGWGGVRIEDQLLITKDGYENMTAAASSELIEL